MDCLGCLDQLEGEGAADNRRSDDDLVASRFDGASEPVELRQVREEALAWIRELDRRGVL